MAKLAMAALFAAASGAAPARAAGHPASATGIATATIVAGVIAVRAVPAAAWRKGDGPVPGFALSAGADRAFSVVRAAAPPGQAPIHPRTIIFALD